MGYSGNRYSPLTQINKENVSKLVPVWGYSLADLQGGESFPIVKDGVIYITTHDATAAVDAMTGKQIWQVKHDYPPETLRVVCCGIVNRGAAIYEGMIIRALMDDRLIGARCQDRQGDLDGEIAGSGDPCQWLRHDRRAADRERRRDHGRRRRRVQPSRLARRLRRQDRQASLADLYDSGQGRSPAPRPGKAIPQLTGGGSSWVTGTYDPELDLVYWGIGNPAPWNARARKGDNLFTNSVFAIRPKTGERVWYFQTTPNDPFDYDAVQTPIIATINVGGSPRKVVIQANRSGFLYVLDAKDGKLVAANAYGKVNWASGIDKETGRPIVTDVFTGALEGKNVTVWPSISGVTNWQHLSFSPRTGMLYVNTLHVGMTYEAGEPPTLKPGTPSGAPTVKRTVVTDDPNIRGFLKAVDPLDRQVEVGDALQEPELLVDHGDGEQPRVHRRHDRRVPGARCRHRQDPLELPDPVRHRRPAGDLGTQRQAVRHGAERSRRRLRATRRRSRISTISRPACRCGRSRCSTSDVASASDVTGKRERGRQPVAVSLSV